MIDYTIGYIAGTLTTIAFAPQLLKALTTKSTTDVSLMMLLCSTSGMIFWLFHGILIEDPTIVVANSISIVLASSLLGLKLKNDYGSSFLEFGKRSRKSKNSLLPSRK
jgi:MtN3 and saliva related transmembrane protein